MRIWGVLLALFLVVSAVGENIGGQGGVISATELIVGERTKLRSTREGIFLLNKEDTYVGRSLDLYGEWCVSEVAMFRKIVKEGDVVLDVGANIGAFTVPLANMVGPRGAVVAFEPQRQVYQLLTANVALNELTNCWTYHKGVGEQGGSIVTPKVNYSVPGNFGGISLLEEERWQERGPTEVVEVVRLDDVNRVLTKCPSFVKIDVEGMEVDVVRGGMEMIQKCKPVIHVENNCKRGSRELIEAVGGLVEGGGGGGGGGKRFTKYFGTSTPTTTLIISSVARRTSSPTVFSA